MSSRDDHQLGSSPPPYDSQNGAPPTFAAFSPVTLHANTPSRSARRSTILVHQKSPLLLATPPQVTRALAYSHPFLLPLNTFVGLLTWSTRDPWQSFLMLCCFWGVVLYGDVLLKTAGPLVIAFGLIAGMYGRRYSPLSSSGWMEPAREARDAIAGAFSSSSGGSVKSGKGSAMDARMKHQRGSSEVTNTKHQKTLDEIVETLKELTGRCNVLMDPFLDMTDFLSTQQTPTSATTKPALAAMFVRLLVVTPFWIALTLPPWRVITTRRVVLLVGTVILTWHARVARVTRALLWRSAMIRRLASAITGLHFDTPAFSSHEETPGGDWRVQDPTVQRQESELTKALRKPQGMQLSHRKRGSEKSAGVKFTFIIYENQRRWVGLGWTNSLFAYERPAWTDEHNNAVPPKDDFDLPEVEDGSSMKWRWAERSRWRVDGVSDDQGAVDYDGDEGKNGWIFYDNKWQNGRRGQDGWGRWTKRRKWYRDAELVEVDLTNMPHELEGTARTSGTGPISNSYSTTDERMISPSSKTDTTGEEADESTSLQSTSASSRSFFRPPAVLRKRMSERSTATSSTTNTGSAGTGQHQQQRPRRSSESTRATTNDEDTSGLGIEVELELQKEGKGSEWGIGDEARMSLE